MLYTVLYCILSSLRALYGTDLRHNGIHCSETCQDATREIRFFFHDSQFMFIFVHYQAARGRN